MKKVLFLATALVVLSLSSCKKDYECKGGSYDGGECLKCTKLLKDAFESSCSAGGGTVSKK